jgi:hypothetical protein
VKNKPGNKGDFHGQRDVFLRANMDDYLAASKKGKTRNFWPELFKNYLEKFHWRLPLDQEPSPDDNFPPDSGLSAHDIQEKTKVLTELKRVGTDEPFSVQQANQRHTENKVMVQSSTYRHGPYGQPLHTVVVPTSTAHGQGAETPPRLPILHAAR